MNSIFLPKSLTLEQFVTEADGTDAVRMARDLVQDDFYLARITYSADDEYTAMMDSPTQFLYALLILKAEGR
jgi:hypothetical protein